MKKNIKFVALALTMLLFTGCVRYNGTMEIKSDKSMDLNIIYAMDLSAFGNMSGDDDSETSTETVTAEQKAELEKKGFKVKDYKDGNYKGVEVSYSVKNIDEVSKEDEFNLKLSDMLNKDSDTSYFFVVKKGFLSNTYKAVFKFDTSDSSSGSSMDLSSYLKNMDMNFKVVLPNSAKSNNATSTEDNNKSLTWDLTKNKSSDINFEFEMYNMTNIIIICVIGAIILAGGIVAIVLISKKKKENKVENNL